jgi:hypothetical protein
MTRRLILEYGSVLMIGGWLSTTTVFAAYGIWSSAFFAAELTLLQIWLCIIAHKRSA